MTRQRDKLCLLLGEEHHSRAKPYPLLLGVKGKDLWLDHQGSNLRRTQLFIIHIAKVPVMCYPAQTRVAAKNRNCTHKWSLHPLNARRHVFGSNSSNLCLSDPFSTRSGETVQQWCSIYILWSAIMETQEFKTPGPKHTRRGSEH